jgi:hypothetical protein
MADNSIEMAGCQPKTRSASEKPKGSSDQRESRSEDPLRLCRESTESLALLLDLGPGIPQRYRQVEDNLCGRRVQIGTEVALPFELEAIAGLSARQAAFHASFTQHSQ